jgi:hypothetical protein
LKQLISSCSPKIQASDTRLLRIFVLTFVVSLKVSQFSLLVSLPAVLAQLLALSSVLVLPVRHQPTQQQWFRQLLELAARAIERGHDDQVKLDCVVIGNGQHRHTEELALAFVVALLAWALLARLVRLLIHATPLSIPDRLLGALFGALRGGVLLLALATVLALTPASQSAAWQGSHGARWLHQGLAALKPLLPEAVSRHIRT